jgi:hypothetical protein
LLNVGELKSKQMKRTLLFGTLLLVAGGAIAQTDKSKKVETKYLSLPAYDVSAIDPSSISIEFAMGDGQFGTEKLKDTKSKCVPKGGGLKDVVEVTAYHYEIPYTQAESYIVAKSNDGTVVYADKASEAGQSTIKFGYDEKMKQSMCEYWMSDKLKKDFAKQGAAYKTKAHNNYVQSTFDKAFATAMANVSLSYMSEEFEVYTAKGKDDYTDLDNAQEKAISAYESIQKNGVNDKDFASLKEAIAVWEKELESLDAEDKKARINEKIAKGLHENCVYAYLYMFDFDNAKKHAESFKKLFGNFSNNRTNAMDEIIKRIYLQSVAAGKNKAILNDLAGLHAKASGSGSNGLMSQKLGADQVERLKSEFMGYRGSQAMAVNAELKKDEEEKIASGELNPYQKYYVEAMAGGAGIMMNMPPSVLSGIPELTEFPKEICEFTDAKQVIILNNKIESVPADIAKMTELKKLDLSGNQLKTLPAEIGQLENLQTLKLSKNPIESLPAELGNCKNLKSLVIKGTKLSGDQIAELQKMLPDCKIKS